MVAQKNNVMIQNTIIKTVIKGADLFFQGVLGFTLLDILFLTTNGIGFDFIAGWLKAIFALLGIIYFIASWPHKRKMERLKEQREQAEIDKLIKENKG
jgi:predicted membrane protein